MTICSLARWKFNPAKTGIRFVHTIDITRVSNTSLHSRSDPEPSTVTYAYVISPISIPYHPPTRTCIVLRAIASDLSLVADLLWVKWGGGISIISVLGAIGTYFWVHMSMVRVGETSPG